MIKKMSHIIISAALLMSFSVISSITFTVPRTYAASCNSYILTFPAWYNGVVSGSRPNCEVKIGGGSDDAFIGNIVTIVLNIVEIILQLIGYASVIFIIIGGFRYMTSAGDPNGIKAAKVTIMNAIIGLIITLSAVAIVNIVGNII